MLHDAQKNTIVSSAGFFQFADDDQDQDEDQEDVNGYLRNYFNIVMMYLMTALYTLWLMLMMKALCTRKRKRHQSNKGQRHQN